MQTANPRRWSALAVIALAQFMVIMDTSIIGVALPEIQADVGFTPDTLSWVFNAYVVAFGGLLLLGGRLSDLLGAKRIFALGWAILAAGSLAAGLADSTTVEIVARAVQGAGAALIAPSALTLLMMLFGSQPEGAHQGLRRLRRRRPGRRHRRRLPRRRDHRVDQLAVDLLHQHPDRAARAGAHAAPHARRAGPARLDRHPRRPHRHRRPGADRLRHRPRPAGRLGLRGYRRQPGRGPRADRRVRRDAGDPARAADAARDLPRPQPGRRQPRASPARRGVDPDVVLPEPLPPAGARLRRLRGRRRAAADDRRDHARHGARRARG